MVNKNITKLNKRLLSNEASLEDVSEKLEIEESSSGLAEISCELNKIMRSVNSVYDDAQEAEENLKKKSNKKLVLYGFVSGLALISFMSNVLIGLLLLALDMLMVAHDLNSSEYYDLRDILNQACAQRKRTSNYKHAVIDKISSKSKDISDKTNSSFELAMLYDVALNFVQMLLNGENPEIDSPLLEEVIKEILKDENHPDASLEELVKINKAKKEKARVLEKTNNKD
ncbi:MAG: hypothetical protein Q4C33_03330 [bacterium]|nr:hypothetical protein [bacterium]